MQHPKRKTGKGKPAGIKSHSLSPKETAAALPGKSWRWLLPAAILLLTLLVYLPSLRNGFVLNWDDGGYITENPVIQNISSQNIHSIFTSFYKGNYHPLTTLGYALEYGIAGDQPFLYHLVNLLLHLANVYLVFFLVKNLTRKEVMAGLTALLFGIHPMHVESVAWVSEFKDVLYTFFFLLSCIQYLYYKENSSRRILHYTASLLLFLLSLGAKSAAVPLPFVLILADYLKEGRFRLKQLPDKLPFLALSVLFGVLAILSQGSRGAIQDLAPIYSIPERLLIACYTLSIYIIKLLAPLQLSAMYPYPSRTGGLLPWAFYASPLLVTALAFLVYRCRKYRVVVFGALFFCAMVAPVLQLLPVGGAILSERYTYVPYIGLFAIAGWAFQGIADNPLKRSTAKYAAWLILGGFLAMNLVLSRQRTEVWKDGKVLFDDMIAKNPHLAFAYNNRGYFYYKYRQDNEKALQDFSMALQIDSSFHRAYSNRGIIYHNQGKDDLAIADFNKALKYNPENTDAILGRGNAFSVRGDYAKAIADYNRYLQLDPGNARAYMWRGIAWYRSHDFGKALPDLNACLRINPAEAEGYYWRGLLRKDSGDTLAALEDFETSIRLDPKKAELYSWRGFISQAQKRYDDAIRDFSKALALNPEDVPSYVNRASAFFSTGRYEESLADLESAIRLGYRADPAYVESLRRKAGK